MTLGQALYTFFNSFGVTAYPDTNVPDEAVFPYMTYTTSVSGWLNGEVSLTVQLWYKTESEAVPNAKAEEIKEAIGAGGQMIPVTNGAIWIKRGTPFCINSNYSGDKTIKLRQMNVTVEFLTTD